MKLPIKLSKNQVNVLFGYKLIIKRAGAAKSERVGHLFETSDEAVAFKDRHFTGIAKWSVEAVRLNIQPKGRENDSSNN